MPTTYEPSPDTLRRLAVATSAYATAIALVAGCILPTVLTPIAVVVFLPKPPPVVARSPKTAPAARSLGEVAP